MQLEYDRCKNCLESLDWIRAVMSLLQQNKIFKFWNEAFLLCLRFFTFQKQDVSLRKIQFLVSRTEKDCFIVNLSKLNYS